MPGVARLEGKLAGWTPERAYEFMMYALRKEGSRFLEQRPPEYVRATQGKGQLIRTFTVHFEPTATGTHIWIEVTSPEDWPVHAKAGMRRVATGLGISALGVIGIAFCLANRIRDLPLIGSILLFGAGAPVLVVGWAQWRHARMLTRGQATALWLP